MAVAKAPPDGYTILMATVGIAVDKILKPVDYDAERDFAPVTLVVTAPLVLLASPKLGVSTLQEFLSKYKDAKDLTFSSGGAGPCRISPASCSAPRAEFRFVMCPIVAGRPLCRT